MADATDRLTTATAVDSLLSRSAPPEVSADESKPVEATQQTTEAEESQEEAAEVETESTEADEDGEAEERLRGLAASGQPVSGRGCVEALGDVPVDPGAGPAGRAGQD